MDNFIKFCTMTFLLILMAAGSRLMAHPPTPMNPMSEDGLHADMKGGVHGHYLAILCQAEAGHVMIINVESDSVLVCLAKSRHMGFTLSNKNPNAPEPTELGKKLYDFILRNYDKEDFEKEKDGNEL